MWQFSSASNMLRPHIKVNGTYSVIKEVNYTFNLDTNYHVKLEIGGNIIKTYINGSLIDTTIDSTFSSGKIGFRQNNTEHAHFDNVVVREIPLLREDFGGDLGKWSNTSNCAIESGELSITNNETIECTSGGTNWTNYVIEADVNIKNNAAGIVFRKQDDNNFYMWQFDSVTNQLRLHKKVGGVFSVIKEVSYTFKLNTNYHIRIEAGGSTIKTYVNGNLIATATDSTFSSGRMGFRQYDTDHAHFDNVVVWKL